MSYENVERIVVQLISSSDAASGATILKNKKVIFASLTLARPGLPVADTGQLSARQTPSHNDVVS